ncbi:DUF397 domain-containing protein [Spirillospora sp. NPDC050679]
MPLSSRRPRRGDSTVGERGVPALERARLIWRKSHRSGGTDCVEVARRGDAVLIRDSRAPGEVVLELSRAQWSVLARTIRRPAG